MYVFITRARVVRKWTENLIYVVNSELVAELPFILMHPKPEEEEPAPPTARPSPTNKADGGEIPLDTNLIQLDTYVINISITIWSYSRQSETISAKSLTHMRLSTRYLFHAAKLVDVLHIESFLSRDYGVFFDFRVSEILPVSLQGGGLRRWHNLRGLCPS